jgi:peptide-methionine (S)-S-oxide reductase
MKPSFLAKSLAGLRTAAVLGLGLAALWIAITFSSGADTPVVVPPPAFDLAPGASRSETVVFAGGCFWGVQGVFQHVAGVQSAVSGYAGGSEETASYERVGTGGTGHAEAVRIVFDPQVISYGQLLQIYFSVAHDPTQLNRQGPDFGPQYRSTVFASDEEQARIASAYIGQLTKADTFGKALVTTVETGRSFYPAEAGHQDYMLRNPRNPYIVVHDLPKLEQLKRLFPQVYRAEPALALKDGKLR